MKKNLFLRLCLILGLLSLNSCRQDLVPEKETYNNSSAFQLTSTRISLSEAKHKTKLVSEIEQVENEFKAKSNAFGKTVNYGNGVSIDTDDVIYIENGPNYYTYTFRINRANAPADAPVENLVLSPLSDGTYRELLVSYSLTSQEKQQLENGLFVDLTKKVISTELASGTYGTNLMGKTTSTQCHWESATVNVSCPCEGHTLGQECTCPKGKPKQYVITWNVCEEVEDSVPTAGSPESGGSSGGGGTGTLTPPCDENGIPSQPQDPSSTLGNQPCNNGTVTLPNLPNLGENPCRKTNVSINAANTVLKNPTVQSQMDAVLKGKTQATNEWGVAIGQASNGYEVTNAVEGIPGQNQVSSPVSQLTTPFIGDGHSHKGARGNPSGGDLYEMIKATLDHPGLTYRFVYGHSGGVPEVYALVINDKALAQYFLTQYPENENCNNTNNDHSIKKGSKLGDEFYKAVNHYSEGRFENTSGENYEERTVGMAYILEKFNVGISIAKVDANGNLKKINASVEQITISNSGGAVKEGIKVSKCP
ncbi:hypothetical protein [Chryseobacterium wangxinyae]|uniref:hypothetical protein n=1 Tax=Chryseobacterium sp. CY353 TaxID=2997334 RepID=UPI00226F0200|nr:hypothetical protein [Chryseobacterium sp. CY353]MCY0969536.1 hypothetical protein [Chryseobacterium sp. CY353]